MTFYRGLSRYYEELSAVSPEEMEFIRGSVADCRRLLDVGYGPGHKTELLAQPNRKIIGLDLDPDMIETARAGHHRPGLKYMSTDMLTLDRLFPPAAFDGLLCLGNTLPHLTGDGHGEKFMAAAAKVMAPGGRLVIQILNYDFIGRRNITELPLIESEQAIFSRAYDWTENGLIFRTRLEIKNGPIYDNEINLRPLYREEVEKPLEPSFRITKIFGGLDGRAWSDDSIESVFLADRR